LRSRTVGHGSIAVSCNLIDDGLVGQQVFAGEATRLAYMTDGVAEGP
jgi:1,4-dihydroxy-2-naphthoyl-CoA synthase